jgi:hypothetical protein
MKPHLQLLSWAMALVTFPGFQSTAQNSLPTNLVLTPAKAESLVIASLSNRQKRLPGIQTEQFRNHDSPRFFFFTVMLAPPANWSGSVVVGNYAVDLETGDVFGATASCSEESNRKLRSLQPSLRLELGLTDAKYRRLKTNGPLCLE